MKKILFIVLMSIFSSISALTDVRITVFVHGTIFPVTSIQEFVNTLDNSYLQTSGLISGLVSGIEETVRLKSIIAEQFIGNVGLREIEENNAQEYSIATKTLLNKFKEVQGTDTEKFYLFGWNGLLDHKERIAAALALTKELTKLKETYAKIELNIIAHSHGGNVVLNMAQLEEAKDISVDRAIFLGTPVQQETEKFVDNKMFKRIYHIYSMGDVVQVLDKLSTAGKYSHRSFLENRPNCPENLTEIKIQIGDIMPNHVELWFYGEKFAPILFRKKLIFYPFPVVCFVPALVKFIEDNKIYGTFTEVKLLP